jgi:hypothetical protein
MGMALRLQETVKSLGGLRINSGGPGIQRQEIIPGEIKLEVTDAGITLEHTVYANHNYTRKHLLEVLRRNVGEVKMEHEETTEGSLVRVTEKIPWLGKPLLEENARKAIELKEEIARLAQQLEEEKGTPNESAIQALINKNSKNHARAIKNLKDILV